MSNLMKKMKQNDNLVKLYVPVLNKQCLLYNDANIICVETLLKLCKVKYDVIEKKNVQYMSTTGYIPIIRYNMFLLCDFASMVDFFTTKLFVKSNGNTITDETETETPKQETVGLPIDFIQVDLYTELKLSSLIKNLEDLEKYVCWFDHDTYSNETSNRYGSVYPWPLNAILINKEYNQIKRYLSTKQIYDLNNIRSSDEVYNDFKHIIGVFSTYLNDETFCVGKKPSAIDSLLFGHLNAILHYQKSNNSSIFKMFANYILSNNIIMNYLDSMQRYIN